jgi:hypothetical protein
MLQRTEEKEEYKAVPTVRNSDKKQCGELNVKLYSDLSPQLQAVAALPPGTKPPVLTVEELGGPQGDKGRNTDPARNWELKYNHRAFWISITALRLIIGCSDRISAEPSAILRFFVVFLSTCRICQVAPQ